MTPDPSLSASDSDGDARSAGWRNALAAHQTPSRWRAIWQIVNTTVPYFALWVAMYWVKDVSLWLTVPLAIAAGAFLVRIFVIFHDCGHGSFFRSPLANDVVGSIAGALTFTPYHHWRWQHSVHHRTSGHLDKRGTGDIWTMTVQEYLDASAWTRIAYRFARNPVALFLIAPILVFVFQQRLPDAKAGERERRSVARMNLTVSLSMVATAALFGVGPYLLIQTIAWMTAGAAGVWLFYVQHQFEGTYWERGKDWDYVAAALEGSSFYKLPRVLQWFSGNIGFHHIHHLNSRIPNYNLERCHESNPLFTQVRPVTLFASLRSLHLRFWDEAARKLVGYSHVRQLRAMAAAGLPVAVRSSSTDGSQRSQR